MRRREFIAFIGCVATGWLLAARGQQPRRMRSIGALLVVSQDDPQNVSRFAAFAHFQLPTIPIPWVGIAEE